ncbi:putative peroxin-3 [Lyophyllum shimeji]|uniref:Peroxin-3 n=1 Tax=Lyophyllum shimeji TaxID=47721 RepID=A0A9P3Q152_LYOSH|nr:putative peroxin-3 [Lyophyllum shimeji]
MLSSVKKFVSERRKGLATAAAVAGGVYVVRGFVRDRLEEIKDRLERERVARENLRRRFDQTQENVAYTVMALVQTLAEQVLREMDVEGLTAELQGRSRARRELLLQRERERERGKEEGRERPPSSVGSSVDVVSDAESAVVSVASGLGHEKGKGKGKQQEEGGDISTEGLQSWVEESGTPRVHQVEGAGRQVVGAPESTRNGESSVDSVMSSSMVSDSSSTRTTAELWNEVKILTFTRTLTTLYSTTLLSLLTTIQLTLLARSKYIHSVLQLEREERMQDRLEDELSLSNILMKSGKGLEELLAGDMSAVLDDDEDQPAEAEYISEEVESRFLTLSWWILHVGWKDVGERVRRGVEEAFEGVSLKSKLAAIDLHRLVSDVRRRVEHEVTFEGKERRINFLSSLLPPTPETVQHVLTQGGFSSQVPPAPYDLLEFDDISAASASSQLSQSHPHLPTLPVHLPHTQDPAFTALLDETREIIASPDFTRVLEVCLDQATDVLFAGLEKSVFVESSPALPPAGEPVRIRLAGLLPGLARWSRLAMNALPNELVDNILAVREVGCLSGIMFARFEERFR